VIGTVDYVLAGNLVRVPQNRESWRMQTLTRRGFLLGAAGAATLARLPSSARATDSELPPPARSGIDHIVVVTMENRSFDHLLGWLPGANGKQAGLIYRDRLGREHSTYRLAPDFQGCRKSDPDHSYLGGRVEYNNGRCDGWLRAGLNDDFAIGYYTRRDLPFLGEAATAWTVCDNYFCALLGPTFPNRIYLHTGRTDRISNTLTPSVLPTIWDRLKENAVTGRYFAQNFSLLGLWGAKYATITRPYTSFLQNCRSGDLPSVAYVEPLYTLPLFGNGNDYHPPSDIRSGESFLDDVYRAVVSSPAWPRTLLVIVFDEWGGFFDHVRPKRAPDVAERYSLRGFRVPCLLISPFARRGYVDHGVYDHGSVLKLIEWRFRLRPLAPRDARANNLAAALDFDHRNNDVTRFRVPKVGRRACPPS
jgi:phospholipase C